MEEIKVGEYIRTKGGCIFKATEYWLGECYSDRVNIKKHSPNIINLIEEGDYVNGKLIHKLDIRENSAYIYYGNGKTFCDYQIKQILTKEKFESESYRLEE